MRIAAAFGSLALTAGLARGASDGFNNAVPTLEESTPWIAWLFSAAFVAAIAVVGFKNSKRTHLD
jgi:hypothetical protein